MKQDPDTKEQLAAVKKMVALKESEKALRETMPMIPIEGENLEEAYNAEVQMEERAKEREAEEKARAEKATAEYQFYVKCRRDHGKYPPHGIYLTVNPMHDYVKPDQWYARYKARTDVWREDIYCQVCLWQKGEYVNLDVVPGPKGTFKVNARMLWRTPKDAKRRQVEGGDTRAIEIGPASSNNERKAAQERAREAGLEVL